MQQKVKYRRREPPMSHVKRRIRARIGKAASMSNRSCETMKLTAMNSHRLDAFHRGWLRAILDISWRTMRQWEKGCEWQAQSDSKTLSLQGDGHILRLQRDGPTHTAMYWVPEDGIIKRRGIKEAWWSTFENSEI